jgi:hypothetical protein
MASTLEGAGWRLELPDGLIPREHTAHGYESGALARGWVGEAPVTVIVQQRELDTGFNEWVRQVSASWLEADSRRIEVPGAKDAVRIDGIIEFDGLGAVDDRERCVAVCAKRGRRAVGLTIRSRPEDGVDAELEPIVDSLELLP